MFRDFLKRFGYPSGALLLLMLLSGSISPGRKTFAAEVGESADLNSVVLDNILSLRFDKADSLLDMAAGSGHFDPVVYYLQNYLEFTETLISGARSDYEAYMMNAERRTDSLRLGDGAAGRSSSYLSSLHLQSSLLSVYHGESFSAARNFYQANRRLLKSEAINSSEVHNLRNRGLISLAVASVPDEYQWFLKVLGIRGTFEEGMEYLDRYYAMASGSLRIESCLIRQLAANTFNDCPPVTGTSRDCISDSLTLLLYAAALEDLGAGRSGRVVRSLQHFQQAEGEKPLPYLDLLLGEAMLNGLDESAREPYERFINSHRGESYQHYAWHKLSWAYLIAGDSTQYRRARQHVLDAGNVILDADRQSLAEAQDTLPVNIGLLKSRLLFDGGYYLEALKQLKGETDISLPAKKDSVEYRYRLGRIYDRLGNGSLAESYYNEVLESASDEKWYFVPNSALQLGYLYESEGDTARALEYYRVCLKINHSAYRRSIDYKARRGIRRIED